MAEPIPITRSRDKLVLLLLAIGVLSLAVVPLIVLARLSPQVAIVVAGLFLFGIPQLVLLAVIAVIGSPSSADLSSARAGKLRLFMPASTISKARYLVGLLLFTAAVLVTWIEPVISEHFVALSAHVVAIGILADAMLLVALFVLAAGFWDKLHALFVQDAKVSGPITAN